MNLNWQIEHWLAEQRDLFARERQDRPFVSLSYAQSWDGSITLHSGESLALSSARSTQLTHHLRSLHDGILVGIGTVLADDPQLTVREWQGPDPQPIVLDAHLRMPANARLCQRTDKTCWILTSAAGEGPGACNLNVIRLPGNAQGQVCLHRALQELKQRGIGSLMVEGGAHVITAFLKQKLVDAIIVTVAPKLVGGYKALGDLAAGNRHELPGIQPLFTQRLDDDLIMWGRVCYPSPATQATSQDVL